MNIRNLGYGSTQGTHNQPIVGASVGQEYQRRLKEAEDTDYLLELGKQGLDYIDPAARQALEQPDSEWGLTEDDKTKRAARAANWAEMTKSGKGAVNLLSDTWDDMQQLVKAATVSSLHSAPTEGDYETSGQKIASMMSKIEKEASAVYAKDGLRGLMDAAGNIVKSQLDRHGYWGVYAAATPFGSMFKTANLARKAAAREKLKTHAEERLAQAEFDVLHPGLEQPRADYIPSKTARKDELLGPPIWEAAAPGTGTPTKKFDSVEDAEEYYRQLSMTQPPNRLSSYETLREDQRKLFDKWSKDLSAQFDRLTSYEHHRALLDDDDIAEFGEAKARVIQATVRNRLKHYEKAQKFYNAVDEMPTDEVNRQLRAIEHGFNIDAFHGTISDIKAFDIDQFGGTSTGARSAKLGYFFSSDPVVPNHYITFAARNLKLANLGDDIPGTAEMPAMRPEDPSFNQGYRNLDKEISKIRKDIGLHRYPSGITDHWEKGSYVNQLREKFHALNNLKRQYGGNIMPVKLRLENPKYVDWGDAHILQEYLEPRDLKDPSLIPVAQQFGYSYKHRRMYDMVKEAKKQGHDGLVFRNIKDPGPSSDHYVVFDAKNIKSIFAKFEDPRGGDWWSDVDDTGGLITNFILPVGLTSAGAAFTANIENE